MVGCRLRSPKNSKMWPHKNFRRGLLALVARASFLLRPFLNFFFLHGTTQLQLPAIAVYLINLRKDTVTYSLLLGDVTSLQLKLPTMASKQLAGKMDNFVIGIIGMGDMGKMYARRLSAAGWR